MDVTRTYGTLAFESGQWMITDLEPHVRMRLKHIFPRVPAAAQPPYIFPNDLIHMADLQWFTDRYPLEISASDRSRLTDGRLAFDLNMAEMNLIKRPDYVMPAVMGLRDGQVIRQYQGQPIELVMRSGRLLCGDDVGLGKTYTSAGMFLRSGGRNIAVCYPHLQKQWQEKIESFTNLRCHPIKTKKPYSIPDSADVLIFRWSQIAGWADLWSTLAPAATAFDEVQELRTGVKRAGQGSERCTSAKVLAQNSRYVMGLSATPIYNYGTEIWDILDAMDIPVLGPRDDFSREWCSGTGYVKDPVALGSYLREQNVFLRRTKRDVGQEMPAVSRIIEYIDYEEGVLRSIDDLAAHLAQKATTGEFTERGLAARELDLRVRQYTGVSKAKAVARFAAMTARAGEAVVLAGWHRQVYDIWLEELKEFEPAMYTGTETPKAKAESVRRFREGETDIFIMSLRSGAGLDELQFRSSTIIFGELDWSPGVHHQCIGRLDREGQTDPVTAIFLVTDDGSDPSMMEVLGLKSSQAAGIVDPDLGVVTVHTDETRLQLLVKRYLKKTGRPAKVGA